MRRFLSWLGLVLLCLPALAMADLQPFTKGSLQTITTQREGQPFLLVLWSVDCAPCMKELAHLGELHGQFSPEGLVLISTDGPDLSTEAMAVLDRHGLSKAENWLFADNFPERLRFHIDPNWYGELPRSYFYDTDHSRRAKSGALSRELLEQWLTATRQMAAAPKE